MRELDHDRERPGPGPEPPLAARPDGRPFPPRMNDEMRRSIGLSLLVVVATLGLVALVTAPPLQSADA